MEALQKVFGTVLARSLVRVFGQGLGTEYRVFSSNGTEKDSFTSLPGQRITVFQLYQDGEKREKNHVF